LDVSTKDVAAWNYSKPGDALTGADAWDAMVQTAIASGSFPFAFAPRDLRRFVNGGWMNQYFQDGGTFDNDPVGETINIAHDIDWSGKDEAAHFADVDRRFMMIHVEPFVGSAPAQPKRPEKTLDVNPLELIKNYFPSVMEESETSGLQGIVTVNRKIDEREQFLTQLAEMVMTGGVQAIPQSVLDALADYRKLKDRLKFFLDNLIPDLASTAPVAFAKALAFTAAQKDVFSGLALAYDLATNLADKVKVRPILIAPEKNLSGSGLFAFGGFLVDAFRERDYRQGRYDAYQAWKVIAEVPNEFVLDPKAPAVPGAAEDLFRAHQDEYQTAIGELTIRFKAVIGALSDAAAGSGLGGFVLARLISAALDGIAEHFLKQAGDVPPGGG